MWCFSTAARNARTSTGNKATADKGRKDAEGAVHACARSRTARGHADLFRHRLRSLCHGSDCKIPAARIWPSVEAYFDQVNEVLRSNALAGRRVWRGRDLPAPEGERQGEVFWLSTSLGHVRHAANSSTAGSGISSRTSPRSSAATRPIRSIPTSPIRRALFRRLDVARPRFGARRRSRQWRVAMPAFVKKGCVVMPVRAVRNRASVDASGVFDHLPHPDGGERGYFGVSLTEDEVDRRLRAHVRHRRRRFVAEYAEWTPPALHPVDANVARPPKPMSVGVRVCAQAGNACGGD